MAQSWRSRRDGARTVPPLDAAALERLGLRYVERYATTQAKLRTYLVRKVRERGWSAEDPPAIERLAERFAELGYVNDEAFATARASGLVRRGYGPRRVAASLTAAGVGEADAADATAVAKDGAWEAALAFARRKRIGPFASESADRAGREKAIAALIRAGHDFTTARRIASAKPGDTLAQDE